MADVRIEELDGGSRTVSGPTIGPDGTIYAAYGQTLFAVNPDGSLLWTYDTGAFINGARPSPLKALSSSAPPTARSMPSTPTASPCGESSFLSITPVLAMAAQRWLRCRAVPSAGPYKGQLQNFDGTADSGWIPDEKFGAALAFDGVNDYVSVPGFKGIGGSAARRVSAWIKPTPTRSWPHPVLGRSSDQYRQMV